MNTRIARVAGALFVIGAIGWTALGLITEFFGPFVGTTAFGIVEAAWILVDIIILAGLIGLLRLPATRGRLTRIGIWIALIARVVFIAAEVHCLILSSDDTPLLPIAALLTAIGMILGGIGLLRSGAGRWGWAVLIVGGYPFVFMFPLAIIASEPLLGIAGWGIAWALLGITLIAGWGLATTRLPKPATEVRSEVA